MRFSHGWARIRSGCRREREGALTQRCRDAETKRREGVEEKKGGSEEGLTQIRRGAKDAGLAE